jgi:hypothetical protein
MKEGELSPMTHQLTHQSDPIVVSDETNLGPLLDEATTAPLRIERNGIVFQLSREEVDPWAGYDPERVRTGLRRVAGLITPEEAARMKELVYRGREEGTRPIDRP